MQRTQLTNIDEIAERILPITYLRRNPGRFLKKLDETGGFIITKDGKPLGKLLPLDKNKAKTSTKEKLKKLKAIIGGFHLNITLTPAQINTVIDTSYEKMLS